MKKLILLFVSTVFIQLLAVPLSVFAQGTGQPDLFGEASASLRNLSGDDNAAKFREYRDVSNVSGDLRLDYDNKSYFFELTGKDIPEDDVTFDFLTGVYGKFKIRFAYDQIPHRFASDAKTLYSGVGSENLTIDPAIRQDLENVSTASVGDLDGDGTPDDAQDRNIAGANRLANYIENSSNRVDLELLRKKWQLGMELTAIYPFIFKIDITNEDRDGTRQFGGALSFGNTIEIPEPINYNTKEIRLTAVYAKKDVYFSTVYYVSKFQNNTDSVRWDNPFRTADATESGAIGNQFYTSGAAASNTTGVTVPFDAFNRDNLPASSLNGKVNTTLYNFFLTSRPKRSLHFKAKYRYYEYDNQTEQLEFPGRVRFGGVWRSEVSKTLPNGYIKRSGGIQSAYEFYPTYVLTLGYTHGSMNRTFREVLSQKEDTFKISLDKTPLFDWINIRTSYERSSRTGKYILEDPVIAAGRRGPAPQTTPLAS